MSRYWLTPVLGRLPLRLGANRISCEGSADLDDFRAKLQGVHPWLLPMFKATMLLSDNDEVCGSAASQIDWSHAHDLVFDGEPFDLSHCAEAFFDRVLCAEKAASLLNFDVKTDRYSDWTPVQLHWLKYMSIWLHEGREVILLREDGV
jgi:hypothetical protein